MAALLEADQARSPFHTAAHADVAPLAQWGSKWCCTAHLATRWWCTPLLVDAASRRTQVDGRFLQRGHPTVASRLGDMENHREKLSADIARATDMHALDMLCLSELGEGDVGIGKKLSEGGVNAWIRELLADSAVSPVAIYADGHYATLVLSDRLEVLQYRVIRDFVPFQRERCFQHFRVRMGERDVPISIVNCHAPSSRQRMLPLDGPQRYCTAFHEACAGDPFIWGGDFNTGIGHLFTILERMDERYFRVTRAKQPGSLQAVVSNPLMFRHGDAARTFGLYTVQVNSEIGVSFDGASDEHDVVVAMVYGIATSPAPRPEPEASSASSAAQPALQGAASSAVLPPMPARPAQQPEPEPNYCDIATHVENARRARSRSRTRRE